MPSLADVTGVGQVADAVSSVSSVLSTAMNKIWPSETEKASAQAIQMKAAADAAIMTAEVQLKLALAEASSGDKWTSRARPSFLYVMYVLILWSIPMGFLAAFKPDIALGVANGMKAWLAAVPDMLWEVFGYSFAVYTVGRSGQAITQHITSKMGKK